MNLVRQNYSYNSVYTILTYWYTLCPTGWQLLHSEQVNKSLRCVTLKKRKKIVVQFLDVSLFCHNLASHDLFVCTIGCTLGDGVMSMKKKLFEPILDDSHLQWSRIETPPAWNHYLLGSKN